MAGETVTRMVRRDGERRLLNEMNAHIHSHFGNAPFFCTFVIGVSQAPLTIGPFRTWSTAAKKAIRQYYPVLGKRT